MITYGEVKKKLKEVRFIEEIISKCGYSKHYASTNGLLIDTKRKYRNLLKELKKQSEVKVFDCKDENGETCYDYWQEMYDIEYDGSKAELLAELDEKAKVMAEDVRGSGYDCTGKSFMTGFKVGHILGNRYRVLVGMAIDI